MICVWGGTEVGGAGNLMRFCKRGCFGSECKGRRPASEGGAGRGVGRDRERDKKAKWC